MPRCWWCEKRHAERTKRRRGRSSQWRVRARRAGSKRRGRGRVEGPAYLEILALEGENVHWHGRPLLDGVLGHFEGDVLMTVVSHVNPKRVLLRGRKGKETIQTVSCCRSGAHAHLEDRISDPFGGKWCPGGPAGHPLSLFFFFIRHPGWFCSLARSFVRASETSRRSLTSVAISFALLCLSPFMAGDADMVLGPAAAALLSAFPSSVLLSSLLCGRAGARGGGPPSNSLFP